MKQKIVAMCIALSMLTSIISMVPVTSFAENAELYSEAGGIVLTTEQYDAKLAEIEGSSGAEFVENEEYVSMLLRRKLVDAAGYETLTAKMNADPAFKECMEWLFTDTQMLRYYVYGGEPEANGLRQKYRQANSATYMSSFNVLTNIYTKHKEDLKDEEFAPLYKRMMASIALTHSVTIYESNRYYLFGNAQWFNTSDPVGRYELFKKLRNHNMLAEEFDRYSVEDMRLVMCAPIDNAQLEWIHHYYRVKF